MSKGHPSKFFEIVDGLPLDENGCKIWPHGKSYPNIRLPGRPRARGNRIILERKLGRPIASGLKALHTCDVPRCVNKDHLYEGSQQQNVLDAVSRGRWSQKPPPGTSPVGDDHWTRTQPEKLARGDRNGARTRPETRARGAYHGMSKLNEQNVKEIRSSSLSSPKLATLYGVTKATVLAARKRITWRHVP